jgi:hypothetical protein
LNRPPSSTIVATVHSKSNPSTASDSARRAILLSLPGWHVAIGCQANENSGPLRGDFAHRMPNEHASGPVAGGIPSA